MATVKRGSGTTQYGPGVRIDLTGDEVAHAIDVYLHSQRVIVRGPRTITSKGELLGPHQVYVDPSGFVICDGVEHSGRG
jgi:hypothetical protein